MNNPNTHFTALFNKICNKTTHSKIRLEIILWTFAILAMAIGLIILVSSLILGSVYEKHERIILKNEVLSVHNYLEFNMQGLDRMTIHYGQLDDTNLFIENKNYDYLTNYFSKSFFEEYKVSMVAFYDNKTNLHSALELNNGKLGEIDNNNFLIANCTEFIVNNKASINNGKGSMGVTLLDDTNWLISIEAITDSIHDLPNGYLVFGRKLSGKEVTEVISSLGSEVQVINLDNIDSMLSQSEIKELKANNIVFKKYKDSLFAIQKFKGIFANDNIVIFIDYNRILYTQGKLTIIVFTFMLIAIILLFAGLLYNFLNKTIVNPLVDLRKQIEQILIENNYTSRLEITGSEEFRRVLYSINCMMEKLVKLGEEAEEANKAKTIFLSNMSHELKTPLNGIAGMIQLMKITDLSEEQKDYLNDSNNACNRMLKIIENLVEYSVIQIGNGNIEQIEFSLEELVRSIVRGYSTEAMVKGIELTCRIDSRIPKNLIGDEKKIYHVLSELVDNAIKFTNSGEIIISVEKLPVQEKNNNNQIELAFMIADTGIGIPEEFRDMIFYSFSQMDNSYTRQFQGAGLGLALSKELIEKMGGYLTVESIPGRGSTFIINLNLKYIPL